MVRDELIAAHETLVRGIAGAIARDLDLRGDVDDLVAYGFEGLVEARDRYDASLGVPFAPYAYRRVRGAILDGVREMSRLPRRTIERCRREAAAEAVAESVDARDETRDDELPPESYLAAIDDFLGKVAATVVASAAAEHERRGDPEANTLTALEIARLRKKMALLPERDRIVIHGIYYEGKKVEEIGAELGVSKATVSTRHTRALETLRELLS